MEIQELFDNPQKSLSIIAFVAIVGVVAIGIIGFYETAHSAQIVADVQKTLEAVLIAAGGAKAGLALPKDK
jgi:hypothetical protein